ncbi:MAG: hypothetical protein ACFFD1_09965, partial [Candidatus Thorarchaeota archaeon]
MDLTKENLYGKTSALRDIIEAAGGTVTIEYTSVDMVAGTRRVHETRSLAECWEMLADAPAG